MRWAVLMTMIAGCVQSNQTLCDNGRVCPAGYTCGAVGCVAPGQLEACTGREELDECTTELGVGKCVGGACVVAICGNGVVELHELCDDGNTYSSDGCSGTCTSDEKCGNGIVELLEECDGDAMCSACKRHRCGNSIEDPGEVCDDGNEIDGDGCSFACGSKEICGNNITDYGAGEQCDDGNTIGNDGCSVHCRIEPQLWQSLQPRSSLIRRAPAMAYDAGRRRIVLFGGFVNGYLNETWEYDGTAWIQVAPLTTPPAREHTAMVYDAKRGRIVMFGGISSSIYNDTWEYDGITWTRRMTNPAETPAARHNHAMAYDADRERVVLFGGSTFTNQAAVRLGDTWEYDGASWMRIFPAQNPSARALHAMAFDAKRGEIVLFGGNAGIDETWAYKAGNWSPRSPAAKPLGGRNSHMMVYDATRETVLLYGGEVGGFSQQQTWEFNGTNWSQLGNHAEARHNHAMAYDIRRKCAVVVGGEQTLVPATPPSPVNQTSEFDSVAGWRVTAAQTPSARREHAMVFDTARGRTVMFGGSANGTPVAGQTWELAGLNWVLRSSSGPAARAGHALAYDSVRQRVVLFGGRTTSSGLVDDTWEFDGTTWSQPTTITTRPPAREGHGLAYDVERGRIVLFGGNDDDSATDSYDDTWEYDGVNWTPKAPAQSPFPRANFGMTYDLDRHTVVVVAGASASNIYNDTWEYDGMTWTRRTLTNFPPVREQLAVAYDVGRGRLMIFGGTQGSGTYLDDVWELEALTWREYVPIALLPAPNVRSGAGLSYDPTRERFVLFGGGAGGATAETWFFGYPDISIAEACASTLDYDGDGAIGCADPDCWGVCTPLCPPAANVATCPATPRCGDTTCTAVEDCRSCPLDCPVDDSACPISCGDFFCDAPETALTCPGDCT